MNSDINFDDKLQRFERNIYNNKRGEIRLEVVWRDLIQTLPELVSGPPLVILDAGCGLGQIATRLLDLGHELVMCDISEKMLQRSEMLLSGHANYSRVKFVHNPVQTLIENNAGEFDLVLFHAVLEWMAQPMDVVPRLRHLLKPGGYLSLLFYNRDSVVYRNLVKGNLRKVNSDSYSGDPGSMTPLNPIQPLPVYESLANSGLVTLCHSGVRTFFDLLDKQKKQAISSADLIEMELRFSTIPPFRDLARYIHLILKG